MAWMRFLMRVRSGTRQVRSVVGGAVQRGYTYGLRRISQRQDVNGPWKVGFYGYL